LTASAPLLSLAHARISGIGIPSTIKPGDSFDLVIQGTGYIQSVTDVSIAVGWNYGTVPFADNALGIFLAAFDLVSKSNVNDKYNKSLTLPATAAAGDAVFNAGLLSLSGAAYMPVYYPFNVSFAVGNETS
ncbi:hypothetical protein BD289DRAFT_344446, partial [Coniella lustricola]